MKHNSSDSYVVQNLLDAGFDLECTKRFMECKRTGQYDEQVKMLSAQRRRLLDNVHKEEKRIACLDYLVYAMKKGKDESE